MDIHLLLNLAHTRVTRALTPDECKHYSNPLPVRCCPDSFRCNNTLAGWPFSSFFRSFAQPGDEAKGAIAEIGALGSRGVLNHRAVKKRVWLARGYGSFQSAWRTLQGIETLHMINKGRVRWLAKGDSARPSSLRSQLFGIAA